MFQTSKRTQNVSAHTVNKYGKRYKHRALAKSQTRQTNMTI